MRNDIQYHAARAMRDDEFRQAVKAIRERGGEVEDCRIAPIGDLLTANMVVSGNVPQGAGLSSSASLEVAIGQAFKEAQGLDISQAEIALNGQQAENQFVGCNCGIMDQMISASGERDHALLLDCRTLETRLIPMPEDLAVLIVNSNVRRGLVDSEYNTRRQQCETAARHYGVKALRDLERDGLITRQVFPTKPPSVEYDLTPLGESLLGPLTVLIAWAESHQAAIADAQGHFDAAQAQQA